MKKIPTLFEREFENHKIVGITPELTEGLENIFEPYITPNIYATVKWDGSCCAIRWEEGVEAPFTLYKRYDAKKGKPVPNNAIPCCDPDPITGHQPCWMPCDRDNPADKWFWAAYDAYMEAFKEGCIEHKATKYWYKDHPQHIGGDWTDVIDGARAQTFEAIGTHFQGNPYKLESDILIPHGRDIIEVKKSFEDIKQYLTDNYIEGIVFWNSWYPICKIKRTDFGLEWNGKR